MGSRIIYICDECLRESSDLGLFVRIVNASGMGETLAMICMEHLSRTTQIIITRKK